jgi:ClpP class serine protease
VEGPLFKKANLFVAMSGATSYEILRRDLQVALDDPAITGIMLNVSSPGGEAFGCDELAQAIYAARGKKPIHSYVSGQACSGGYWIASAAETVTVSDIALLGSIGVVMGMEKRGNDGARGIERFEFVSSQSPGKRPDPASDAGKAQIQKMVDEMAQVFVDAVAKHRGVSAETVIDKFGAGGVEVGANAVAFGMADGVGQFEDAFAALSNRDPGGRFFKRSNGGSLMTDTKQNPAAEETTAGIDVAAATKKAADDARVEAQARIKTITTSEAGKARPKLAERLAFETDMSAEAALKHLAWAAEDDQAPAASGDQDKPADFVADKQAAGALVDAPSSPSANDVNAADAAWGKAIARHNGKKSA